MLRGIRLLEIKNQVSVINQMQTKITYELILMAMNISFLKLMNTAHGNPSKAYMGIHA
jgi:hypothetical protein